MPLTEANRVQIRMYLGWNGRWAQFDGALERAMSAVEASPETVDQVLFQITECQRLDESIRAAERRLKADAVGPITLNADEIRDLRDRGAQEVGRLATLLGVEVRSNAFGRGAGYRATAWGPRGGGNFQRHG